jgi:protein-tyrosine phosphatase
MNSHIHKPGDPLDYNYITDGIFIGTNQCCSMGLSEVLKKEGITADISLEDVRIDNPFGVEMYTWLPTKDHTPPSPDQLAVGISNIGKFVSQKRKVYVHCKNGHGRATTLVAAYLISTGKTPEEAIAIVKKGRPTMHLQDAQQEALDKFFSATKQAAR